MVLQQLLCPVWFSVVAMLLVGRALHRFYHFVAKRFSLDSHLNCHPYVSARSGGANYHFDLPLGSRSVWLP